MTVVYDAGMLIALERGDRHSWAKHRVRLEARDIPVTSAPVVAQVSRNSRQALLRRVLRDCDVAPFTEAESHAVGELLAAARAHDVVDAHLVLLASRFDATLLTADERDLSRLARHVAGDVRIKPVVSAP